MCVRCFSVDNVKQAKYETRNPSLYVNQHDLGQHYSLIQTRRRLTSLFVHWITSSRQWNDQVTHVRILSNPFFFSFFDSSIVARQNKTIASWLLLQYHRLTVPLCKNREEKWFKRMCTCMTSTFCCLLAVWRRHPWCRNVIRRN